MPKIPIDPPEGFKKLIPFFEEIENEMRKEEETYNPDIKRSEQFWGIFKLHHQRSRYVFDMYYNKKEISKEVFKYCIKNLFCDSALIGKWKKQGYENLCCMRCIDPIESKLGNVCICRVPLRNIPSDKILKCDSCGCGGCSGY